MKSACMILVVLLAIALFVGKWRDVRRSRRQFRESMKRAAESAQNSHS